MKTTKKHIKSFSIAGYQYNEGALVYNKLKVGKKVSLIAEPDNRFDENAVAIYYKDFKLGYIPKAMNKTIGTLLNLGHTSLFYAVIQQIDPTCLYDGIKVVIYAQYNNNEE
ncbi:HIRAN domain-containing protein [Wenyingzhuangia sp. IMCC45533]